MVVKSVLLHFNLQTPSISSEELHVTEHADTDSLLYYLNTHCSAVLDTLSRMRRPSSVNSSFWLNDTFRCFQPKCRGVEWLWKSTKLHVHRLYYKDLLTEFKNMVKDARASYFGNLISSLNCNPKVLFDTVNSIVSPAPSDATLLWTKLTMSGLALLLHFLIGLQFWTASPPFPCKTLLIWWAVWKLPQALQTFYQLPRFKAHFGLFGPCPVWIIKSFLKSGFPSLF